MSLQLERRLGTDRSSRGHKRIPSRRATVSRSLDPPKEESNPLAVCKGTSWKSPDDATAGSCCWQEMKRKGWVRHDENALTVYHPSHLPFFAIMSSCKPFRWWLLDGHKCEKAGSRKEIGDGKEMMEEGTSSVTISLPLTRPT